MPFILALDQGTTSSRAIVFDRDGAIRAVAQKEFAQIFPQAGWVEHDPQEIWASQLGVAVEALGRAHAAPRDVAAIGITNQRETTIVWDREKGEPSHNAIVWQDRRTADFCERLKAVGIDRVPTAGNAGDPQPALCGRMSLELGRSKNTYGTGCCMLQNIGAMPTRSKQKLVTTVAGQRDNRAE